MGLIAGFAGRQAVSKQSVTLDVEALITKGGEFHAYYNNQWSEIQRAAVRPNQWTHYRFTVPSHLIALRFDPSAEPHTQAYIRSIVVTGQASGHSESVDPLKLKDWLKANIQVQPQPDGSVLLTTEAADAYVMGGVNIDVGSRIAAFQNFRLDAKTLFWCLLASGLVLLLLGIGRRNVQTALFVSAVIVCAVFIARVATLWLLHAITSLPPVASTVGAAAFSGFSKSAEEMSVNLSICMAGILVAVAGVLWRWRRHEPLLMRLSLGAGKPVRLLPFFVLLTFCALFAFPQSAIYLAAALAGGHATDFDSQNIFAWEYLVSIGKLPWRDFWFPYGGFSNRLLPLYPEILNEFLNEVALMAVLLWCSLKIFRNNVWMVFGCGALFMVLQSAQVIWPGASPRYLLCLSIVLVAAVAVQEMSVGYHVFLGVWCIYVVTQEISQAVDALPAAALLVAAGVLGAESVKERIQAVKCAGIAAAVGAGALLLYLAILQHNSQLTGWWDFVSSLAGLADYIAWPARIEVWVSMNGGLESGLLLLTLSLIIGGIASLIWRAEQGDVYSAVPLSMGLVSWMVLQKQIIRPGIENQIIAIPVFGMVVLLYQRARPAFRSRQAAWLAFSMAAVFSCFVLEPSVWDGRLLPWLEQVRSLRLNLTTLFARDKWTHATEAYFAPASFDFGGTSGATLRDRLIAVAPTNPDETVYVLGNNPVLYILLRKPIPYDTNIFNESLIGSQRGEVQWLERNRPKYVFWDADAKEFDGVPNAVRVPLIFTYIIEHYRPQAVEGKYQILQRMDSNQAFAAEYWLKMLGPSADLGYVPAASGLTEQEGGKENAPSLIVHVPSPRTGARASVSLNVGVYSYAVSFLERGDIQTYIIRLDRIPFIGAESASGGGMQVNNSSAGGAQATIRNLPVPAGDLY